MVLLGQTPNSVLERRWDREVTAVKSMGKQKRCPGRPAGILLRLRCQGPLSPTPPFSIDPSSLSEPRKGLTTCSGQDWNSPPGKEPSLKAGEMELALVLRKLGSLQLGGMPLVCFAQEPRPYVVPKPGCTLCA